MTSTDKSKKRRHNNINKVKLWNIFDNEVNADKKPLSLECIIENPEIEKFAKDVNIN